MNTKVVNTLPFAVTVHYPDGTEVVYEGTGTEPADEIGLKWVGDTLFIGPVISHAGGRIHVAGENGFVYFGDSSCSGGGSGGAIVAGPAFGDTMDTNGTAGPQMNLASSTKRRVLYLGGERPSGLAQSVFKEYVRKLYRDEGLLSNPEVPPDLRETHLPGTWLEENTEIIDDIEKAKKD